MLKTILGSAIGGLTAGAVALGVSAFASRPAAGPLMGVDPNNPYAMTVAYTGAPGQGAPVMTQPGYYAPQPAYYAPQPRYASEIVTMPAPRARPVAQPAARRAPAASRERVVAREEDRREDRSWGKTAMIIGGGAGGGAGIGGLIGGKKGALIGAAIGGGAATIYESTKR